MSPEMGTDHSHDDTEPSGSMKEKELEPWLLAHVRNRLKPLSSLSKMTLTIPPIAANIWRRLSSIGSRVSNLSIIKPDSITSVIKPASLSSVWRSMLGLPLLQRTRAMQRTPRYRRASNTVAEEQPVSDVDLGTEESLLEESLPDEYLSIVPAIDEEQTTGVTGEPDLSEYVREVHEVRGERLVNKASETRPLAQQNLLSRSVVDKSQPYIADSTSLPASPPILAQQTDQVISKPGAIEAGEPTQLTGSLSEVPVSQQFSPIQLDDLKQGENADDTWLQSGEYPQPADEGRRLEDTGSQSDKESGLKYIEHLPTQTGESVVTADTSRRLDTGRLPIGQSPKLATSLKRMIISGQDIPLVHPVSLLQRSYMKAGDQSIKAGVKATRLPYVADALTVEDIPAADEMLVQSPGIHYQSPDWSVEESMPDTPSDEGVPDHPPDRGLPAAADTVLGKPESFASREVIQDSDQPAIELSSGGKLDRHRNLEYLTARNIPRRQPEEQPEEGSTKKPIIQEGPLLELLAKKSVIGQETYDSENIPAWQGVSAPDLQPAGETISQAASKIEMPLRYPDTTVLYGETSPSAPGGIQMSASSIPGYVQSTGISPVDEDSSLLSRIRGLSTLSSGDTRRSSLERLSDSSFSPRARAYSTSDVAALLSQDEVVTYSTSQSAQELALTPAREGAEEVTPEPALASVMRQTEVVSRQPVQAQEEAGDAVGEVAGESGSADIYAMARDVYSILKRRIRRDRERMYGLS